MMLDAIATACHSDCRVVQVQMTVTKRSEQRAIHNRKIKSAMISLRGLARLYIKKPAHDVDDNDAQYLGAGMKVVDYLQ